MKHESADIGGLSSDQYGQKYQDHLIEQYKLYVEMADRISSKRTQANSFFLGICTALIAAGAAVYGKGYSAPAIVVFIALLAVLLLCYTWWQQIKSYKQLSSAKYRVILLLEKHLPSAPYSKEWTILGEGKIPEYYRPLSSLEGLVPMIFAILFVLLAACMTLSPS